MNLQDYTDCPLPLLADKLSASTAFHVYARAFKDATSLSLELVAQEGEDSRDPESASSPLCRMLNPSRANSCARCSLSHFHLQPDERKDLVFGECRAGLHYLIAPVRLAGIPIALVEAGQFRMTNESGPSTHHVEAWLEKNPSLAGKEALLAQGFAQSTILTREGVEKASGLLAVFAEILSGATNDALLQGSIWEPAPVRAVRNWMTSRPGGPVTLEEAAAVHGVSAEKLGPLFRESTGLSFREYAERFRLEKARRYLLERPHGTLRGAAAVAGCLTVSELNGIFRNRLGETASEFRHRMSDARRRLANFARPISFPLVVVP